MAIAGVIVWASKVVKNEEVSPDLNKFYSKFYILKTGLLQTELSNFENDASPKYSAFQWVESSTLIRYYDTSM